MTRLPALRSVAAALLLSSCAPVTNNSTAAPSNATSSAPSVAVSEPDASTSAVSPSPVPSRATASVAFNPIGLAVSPVGKLYVSDCDAALVYMVDTDRLVVVAGSGSAGFAGDGGPATAAELNCPTGLAFDRSGDLFVVDHANNRVRRLDTTGVISTIAGSGPTGLQQGSFTGDGGPATSATLREPWGIATDAAGNLYVSDRDNHRIRKIDTKGVIGTIAGNGSADFSGDRGPAIHASLNRPLGLAVDNAGSVYVADENNNRVRRIDAKGIITTVAGTGDHASHGDGGPATKAALADTQDVVRTAAGDLIVTESEGFRIRRIDGHGIISTLAGTGQPGLSGDGGAAAAAMINDPGGLAIDAAGIVYFADRGNHCIRAIDPAGVISSVYCG